MLAVEVIARFADTVVDQRHVLAGGAYRVGACAGSELAVELVRAAAFPIVDNGAAGFVVRRPVDHAATIRRGDSAVAMVGTEHRLAPGERFEVVTGDVTITAALTELPPTRLALSRPEARAPAYIAASTVVHIAVWALAVLYAPLERLEPETTSYRVARLPRAHAPNPTPAPSSGETSRDAETHPAAKQAPPGPPDPDATRAARKPSRQQARGEGASGHVSLADGIRAITGTRDLRKDFEQLGPLYDADEAQSGNFGNSRRFDPTADEDFGTVKTGAYATVATGQAAGQHYELAPRESPDLELCESSACTAVGGLDRETIRRHLAPHKPAITACYHRNARTAVEMQFEIAADGSVVRVANRSPIGACLAGIIETITFPPADVATRVTYTLDPDDQ